MTQVTTNSDEVAATALFAAPAVFWLIDRMAPRRILTVGPACEDLHLAICDTVEAQALNAVCFHVATNTSISFRAARAPHDGKRSRLLWPDAGATRLGVDGCFDLIVLRELGAPSARSIEDWRAGLSAAGVLVAHGGAGPSDPQLDGAATWVVGDQGLTLICGPAVTEDIHELVDSPPDAVSGAYLTLAGQLAASVAERALADQRLAERRAEEHLAEVHATHRNDLRKLSRSLAETVEQSVAQRLELQENAAEISRLKAQLRAQKGEAPRRLTGLFSRRPS